MPANPAPLPRESVLPHDWRIWEALSPVCERCVPAGDLLRRTPLVQDLKIVAQPLAAGWPGVDQALQPLLTAEFLQPVPATPDDTACRRFLLTRMAAPEVEGLPVALYLADAANYGLILVQQTGDPDFAYAMVTPITKGGLRPPHLRCRDGYVWQQNEQGEAVKLPVSNQEALFRAWGLPYIVPQHRSAEKVAELRESLGLPSVPLLRMESASPAPILEPSEVKIA